MEPASRRWIERAWDFAGNRQLFMLFIGLGRERCGEQRLRIGMKWLRAQFQAVGKLDDLSEIHDRNAVTNVRHSRQIMADKQIADCERLLQAAVDNVNLMIRRCGDRIPRMTVADLGTTRDRASEQLPPFRKLFAPGQFRWTAVGTLIGLCGGTVYYLIAILLPKALVDQGAAVALSSGLSSLVFSASIPANCSTATSWKSLADGGPSPVRFSSRYPGCC